MLLCFRLRFARFSRRFVRRRGRLTLRLLSLPLLPSLSDDEEHEDDDELEPESDLPSSLPVPFLLLLDLPPSLAPETDLDAVDAFRVFLPVFLRLLDLLRRSGLPTSEFLSPSWTSDFFFTALVVTLFDLLLSFL